MSVAQTIIINTDIPFDEDLHKNVAEYLVANPLTSPYTVLNIAPDLTVQRFNGPPNGTQPEYHVL